MGMVWTNSDRLLNACRFLDDDTLANSALLFLLSKLRESIAHCASTLKGKQNLFKLALIRHHKDEFSNVLYTHRPLCIYSNLALVLCSLIRPFTGKMVKHV